jgi:5'-phosphate synthase pdxT subunit
MVAPRIGVLALQGDFAAHAASLERAGAETSEVRWVRQLQGLDGLVLPGGESSALLRLMRGSWFDSLREMRARGAVLLGTCAGAILLARRVHPGQECLGLIDVDVERNAYGRQLDSFVADVEIDGAGRTPGVFIRAPRFTRVGPAVSVLGRLNGEPVMVRQGRVLATSFHPELTRSDAVARAVVAAAREKRGLVEVRCAS